MNVAAEQQFPAKWPFPPAPPASFAAALLQARPFAWARRRSRQRVDPFAQLNDARALHIGHAHTPVTAVPAAGSQSGLVGHQEVSLAGAATLHSSMAGAASANGGVTLRRMVVDVLLVAMWGAMIPLFLWLGSAAGF
jgi:hypothetical protein